MFGEISEEEKEEAIRYLMNNVPKDCLKKVFVEIQNKGTCWSVSVHMSFGIYVRNTLRKGGFNWGAYVLDNVWGILVKEAARRVELNE
jgi:hypothetical protein